MITGICVALPEEIGTLTSRKIDKGCYAFTSDTIVVACSGAGASNAQTASRLLIEQGAKQLISWGCAGALSQTLQPGNLVLADSLIDSNDCTDLNFCVSSDWHKHAETLLSDFITFQSGKLLESCTIVEKVADKNRLHSQSGAVALDMESIAIAKVARENNLPFLAIRVIADPADMDLPRAINHSLDKEGDIILVKLLLFIIRHPSELPGLIMLGLHFNAAKKTLRLISKKLELLSKSPKGAFSIT
ncbi:MAG: phosphorylase [Methylobacter sp.]|nr:phosphorylase [Methylobacter sp.]